MKNTTVLMLCVLTLMGFCIYLTFELTAEYKKTSTMFTYEECVEICKEASEFYYLDPDFSVSEMTVEELVIAKRGAEATANQFIHYATLKAERK